MKRPSPARDGLVSDSPIREREIQASPLPFTIVKFVAVDYKAKRAQATIEIAGLGSINVELFVPTNGRESFVQAESVCDRYSGAYRRSVALDDDFRAELLAAMLARYRAEIDA